MTEELSVCVSETTREGEVIGEWQVGTVTREIEQWDRLHHGRTKKEEAEEVRTLPHFKKNHLTTWSSISNFQDHEKYISIVEAAQTLHSLQLP